MSINDGFGEILETGRTTVRKTAKNTAQGTANFAKTAAGQVSSSNPTQGTNEAGTAAQSQQMSDDAAKQFLRDLYGVPNNNQNQAQVQNSVPAPTQKTQTNIKTALGLGAGDKAPTPAETIKTAMGIPQSPQEKIHPLQNQNAVATALGIPQIDPNAGKSPQDLAKIEALRQQLHKDYYENLTKSKKPEEEHVTEKLEREDEEKRMSELEVQKKKPPPLPATVKRGTGETVVGVSG